MLRQPQGEQWSQWQYPSQVQLWSLKAINSILIQIAVACHYESPAAFRAGDFIPVEDRRLVANQI
jgi:hypothetical protein